jgi:NAD-dependent DNA ligase
MGLFDIVLGKSHEEILYDWENEPATEKQIGYILHMGGHPQEGLTKSGASDMIDGLLENHDHNAEQIEYEDNEAPTWALLPSGIELPEILIPEGTKQDIWAHKINNPFYTPNGAVFCMTGDLPYSRDAVCQIILAHGGTVSDSVSTKVDFLLIGGDDPRNCYNAKSMKARELIAKGSSIRIITHIEFAELIRESISQLTAECPNCKRLIAQAAILNGMRQCPYCIQIFNIDERA